VIPSDSRSGRTSSMDAQKADSLVIVCDSSNSPLNSEFICEQPSSTAISIARFQYRTAD